MAKQLRKVLLATATLQDNAQSFVNLTAETLHIKKIVIFGQIRGTLVATDEVRISLDEVPAIQLGIDDSRSHIVGGECVNSSVSTNGAIVPGRFYAVLTFDRGELMLDPDEAFFLNTSDVSGAATFVGRCNIWYED